jgi:hypothetical protein
MLVDNSKNELKFSLFEKKLTKLINNCNMEYSLQMPDFLLAKLLTNILKDMHNAYTENIDWHSKASNQTEDRK